MSPTDLLAEVVSAVSTASPPEAEIGTAIAHESAALHVSGAAIYVDDIVELDGTLHAAIGLSSRAHARVLRINLDAVRAAPDVVCVITAADIPGLNDCGPMLKDDPILADGLVQFFGQPLFAVAATHREAARRAVLLAQIDYEDLPALLDIASAAAAQSQVLPTNSMHRGDVQAALAASAHRLDGRLQIGGQEHFYLEGQVSYAVPKEDGCMHLYCSTQHPSEMQHVLAHALHLPAHQVVAECRRMGGGFGGKESQSSQWAALAALLAQRTGHPVKLRLDRDVDMVATGKRHDFTASYTAGFDDDGLLNGVHFELASRCGFSADLSGPVNDRAMFHVDNAYFLDAVSIRSQRLKTHTVSNTAFRGFGGPQGMIVVEQLMDDIARYLQLDPLAVRRRNFYGTLTTLPQRCQTHYGMDVEDNVISPLVAELEISSDYQARRVAVAQFNAENTVIKRGLSLTPIKFGISFTATALNQAGALVHVYTDGSVLVAHGGTEMGQGLFTKVRQIVAHELGVPVAQVRIGSTDTAKVPNTSATAASAGTDLNGRAAQKAAIKIRERLTDFIAARLGVVAADVQFKHGRVIAGASERGFSEWVHDAYWARVQLWDSGFYATPKIHYDPQTMRGRPFFYFTYGAAVSEVAIDTLTGETRVLRADLLADVGRSINPGVDLGQIEGGFIQGMGWLTSEELWWRADGRLMTHAPSTYKIPAVADVPPVFNVRLFDNINVEDNVYGSKAVGEPPLMLALSVFFAIRDAVAACGPSGIRPELDAPATPEAVLRAIKSVLPAAG
jgi:xanthine dehydrogenase large subunit